MKGRNGSEDNAGYPQSLKYPEFPSWNVFSINIDGHIVDAGGQQFEHIIRHRRDLQEISCQLVHDL